MPQFFIDTSDRDDRARDREAWRQMGLVLRAYLTAEPRHAQAHLRRLGDLGVSELDVQRPH